MKTILSILFWTLFVLSIRAQTIKVNAGLDSVTNTRQKAELTGMVFDGAGSLQHITYVIRKYALNNTTLAKASGSETKRALFEVKEYNFGINGKWINTTTKVIATDSSANHVRLRNYLGNKTLSSYPGIGGASTLLNLIESIMREIIAVKQTSGELPN